MNNCRVLKRVSHFYKKLIIDTKEEINIKLYIQFRANYIELKNIKQRFNIWKCSNYFRNSCCEEFYLNNFYS